MKLYFENIKQDYNGFERFTPVLVGSSWIGIADVEDSLGKDLIKFSGVSEISDSDYEWYKKKLTAEQIAFRQFGTVKQEPEKNPNADYAEEIQSVSGESQSLEDPKELIEVDVVETPEPEEPAAPKKKRAKK